LFTDKHTRVNKLSPSDRVTCCPWQVTAYHVLCALH